MVEELNDFKSSKWSQLHEKVYDICTLNTIVPTNYGYVSQIENANSSEPSDEEHSRNITALPHIT